MVSQPPILLYENFRSCEEVLWHTSAISQPSTPVLQLLNGCEFSTLGDPPFRSRDAIWKGVSQLRLHPLEHKCHFKALYTHFAAAKCLRNLHTLKSFSAHTMNGNVTTTPPFRQLLDTFKSLPEDHFMNTIFCFKAWEVRSPALQTMNDLELKRRSYGCLKMAAQTMSGNVAAAPLLDTFWSTF